MASRFGRCEPIRLAGRLALLVLVDLIRNNRRRRPRLDAGETANQTRIPRGDGRLEVAVESFDETDLEGDEARHHAPRQLGDLVLDQQVPRVEGRDGQRPPFEPERHDAEPGGDPWSEHAKGVGTGVLELGAGHGPGSVELAEQLEGLGLREELQIDDLGVEPAHPAPLGLARPTKIRLREQPLVQQPPGEALILFQFPPQLSRR